MKKDRNKEQPNSSEIILTDEIEFEVGTVVSFNNPGVRFFAELYKKMKPIINSEDAYVVVNKRLTKCPPSRDRTFDFYYYIYDICKLNDPNGTYKGIYSSHLIALDK